MENTWDNEIEIGLMRNFDNALHPFPHIQALCSPDICPLQTLQSSLRSGSVSHRAIFGFGVLGKWFLCLGFWGMCLGLRVLLLGNRLLVSGWLQFPCIPSWGS